MPTTSSGLVYPDSSGSTQIWTHVQNLADSIQTLLNTSYQSAYTSYTPVLANTGTATFSTLTGWWKYIAPKTVFVNIHAVASAVGSGATSITFTTPTSPDRTSRQVLSFTSEHVIGSSVTLTGNGISFTGGSGAVWDRIRIQDNSAVNSLKNFVGNDILSTSIFTLHGIYREA